MWRRLKGAYGGTHTRNVYKEPFRVERFLEILESQKSNGNRKRIVSNNKLYERSTKATMH